MKNVAYAAVLALIGAGFVGCDSSEESTFESGGSGGQAGTAGGGSGGAGGMTFLDSSGGTSQSDTGTGNCPDWGDDDDCKACLKTSCCSQLAACDSDPGCRSFVECTRPCPEPNNGTSECVQTCLTEAGTLAIEHWNAAIVCMGNPPCADACAHL